jgi:hypothetical protein
MMMSLLAKLGEPGGVSPRFSDPTADRVTKPGAYPTRRAEHRQQVLQTMEAL